jgi:hypothetical protein
VKRRVENEKLPEIITSCVRIADPFWDRNTSNWGRKSTVERDVFLSFYFYCFFLTDVFLFLFVSFFFVFKLCLTNEKYYKELPSGQRNCVSSEGRATREWKVV